jgi:REP element-mobilizing transposase RayT
MKLADQPVLDDRLKARLVHGGEMRLGKRKRERPIATKRAMHITLKSSCAVGEWSFLQKAHAAFIRRSLPRWAKHFGVIIYQWSLNGNHVHLLVRPRSRDSLRGFLSALSGRIAQHITGARKGRPFGRRFFDSIPFSRIVEWGKSFRITKGYVLQNELEAEGIIPYSPRRKRQRAVS